MKKEEPQNFGVPEVDNTPMGQIGMMGRFYRGMSERQIQSPIVRIVGTLFALFFLVIPGFLWVYMKLSGRWSGTDGVPLLPTIGYGLLGTVVLLAGLKIIYNLNFRSHKKN